MVRVWKFVERQNSVCRVWSITLCRHRRETRRSHAAEFKSSCRQACFTHVEQLKIHCQPCERHPLTAKVRKSNSRSTRNASTSAPIEAKIKELDDRRGEMLARLHTLLEAADLGVVEKGKWSTPLWPHAGVLFTSRA